MPANGHTQPLIGNGAPLRRASALTGDVCRPPAGGAAPRAAWPILLMAAALAALPGAAMAEASSAIDVASEASSARQSSAAGQNRSPAQPRPRSPDFRGVSASADVRELADWIAASRNNQGLPYLIVDKINAKVFLFDRGGGMKGATAALLGVGRGDDSVPGIGQRKLATITPAERTTPAGRFQASLGHDLEQDILWIDYDSALSLHRVIVGNPRDRRAGRLASPSVLDNRISFGCINVPAAFYDDLVVPAFTATVGIVYILPETRPLRAVFAISARPAAGPGGARTR